MLLMLVAQAQILNNYYSNFVLQKEITSYVGGRRRKSVHDGKEIPLFPACFASVHVRLKCWCHAAGRDRDQPARRGRCGCIESAPLGLYAGHGVSAHLVRD